MLAFRVRLDPGFHCYKRRKSGIISCLFQMI